MLALVGGAMVGGAVLVLAVLTSLARTWGELRWLTRSVAEAITIAVMAVLALGMALVGASDAPFAGHSAVGLEVALLLATCAAFTLLWLWLRVCARGRFDERRNPGAARG